MLQAGRRWHPAGPLGHLENPSKVGGLASVGHVNHAACAIARGTQAVANRRQIGGGVVEAPIAFLHDQGKGFALFTHHAL